MATDNIEIANKALTSIGHETITAFSSSGNKASRWFNTFYEPTKKALMREYQWNFCTAKAVLTRDTINTITGITQANPAVVTTSAAHGRSNGDVIYIDGVVGMIDDSTNPITQINGRTYTVANATGTTFELSGIDTSSGYSAYSSAGSVYGYIAKEYTYRFAVPSDNLRILRINGSYPDEYRVEGGYIYTDEGDVWVEYIFDEGTETNFDPMFDDVFAARLAAEISFYLTDNSTLTEQAWNIYNQKLRMARSIDSQVGSPRNIEADTWLNARL